MIALQKMTSRLKNEKKVRIRSCTALGVRQNRDCMRILRRCEALLRGKSHSYLPSEEALQAAYRELCCIVEDYILDPADLNPEWAGEGLYVDPGKLFLAQMHVHHILLKGQYLTYDVATAKGKTIEHWVRCAFDAAPCTSSESWLFGQQASNLLLRSLGALRSQLTVVLRSGEKSPCARAVVAHMSELWETNPLVLKLTQRSGVSFFTKFHMLVSDWGLKPAVVMCQPANAIAFSAFEHVSMDNVQVCVNKRGDDKTLGLLTYARRCELGELAEKHYAAVEAEAEASGSFTADQLQSRMAARFFCPERSKLQPAGGASAAHRQTHTD